MTTKDEVRSTERALKLALEALERCGSESYTLEREAITAIRAALASKSEALAHAPTEREQPAPATELRKQQEPDLASVEPYCYMDEYGNVRGRYEYWMECEGGWFPLYTSPQQSASVSVERVEPAACIGYWNQKTGAYYKPDQISAAHERLIENGVLRRCYTSPPYEATPLANANAGQRSVKPWVHATTWRGLTDEEIEELLGFNQYTAQSTKMTLTCVAQAIEAKLREKNN